MKYPYRLSDEYDCCAALIELESQRKSEAGHQRQLVRGLHRTNITCTGFAQANPNIKLAYAECNGMFPTTGEPPDPDE
jgi:hypothetical protein